MAGLHTFVEKRSSASRDEEKPAALSGYPIQTSEEAIGHVIDFIIDDKSRAICHLVCSCCDGLPAIAARRLCAWHCT